MGFGWDVSVMMLLLFGFASGARGRAAWAVLWVWSLGLAVWGGWVAVGSWRACPLLGVSLWGLGFWAMGVQGHGS